LLTSIGTDPGSIPGVAAKHQISAKALRIREKNPRSTRAMAAEAAAHPRILGAN
jgi:hypothetical protein